MSQDIFPDIDPNTTDGTELATLLNDFKDAVVSGFSGEVRPANLKEAGYWVKNLSGGLPIAVWDVNFYDGTNDITVFQIDTASQTIITGDISNSVNIVRTSVDNIGPILKMLKSRGTGVATAVDDVLGQVDFYGKDAVDAEYVQAKIESKSTNLVSGTQQGAYVRVMTTEQDTANLTEAARFTGDNKLGVGKQAPESTIHAYGTDANQGYTSEQVQDSADPSSFIFKKKRVAGSGQVLISDFIGRDSYKSVDQNGAEIDIAKVEVQATENHTDAAQGSRYVINLKNAGETAFTEAFKLEDGNVIIYGKDPFDQTLNSDTTVDLLDDQATRNLMTIDGATYGAFTAEFLFFGYDNVPNKYSQKIVIHAIYDYEASTWTYEKEEPLLDGLGELVTLNFTNGSSLVIDYVNQILAANFQEGKIYGKVRRSLR